MPEEKGKIVVAGLVMLVIGVGAGYGWAYGRLSPRIERAEQVFAPLDDVRTLSGVVKSTSGDTITFETNPPENPFEDYPLTRTVVIGENTRLYTEIRVSPEEFAKAMAAYNQALAAAQRRGDATTPGVLPPFPLESQEVAIHVSEVERGDLISVTANYNIKTETRFEAVSVSVQK